MLTGYYCRFCDEFIREDETETKISSMLHTEVDTKRTEYIEYIVCPYCKQELFERADDCICGEMKLESEHLCRDCKKLAKEEWETAIDNIQEYVKLDRFDARELMETYVEGYEF